jgi:hypothetical protein
VCGGGPHAAPDAHRVQKSDVARDHPAFRELIGYKVRRWEPVQTILLSAAYVSSLLCLRKDDNRVIPKPKPEAERQERLALAASISEGLTMPRLAEIRERTVWNHLIHAEQKALTWAERTREARPGLKLGS